MELSDKEWEVIEPLFPTLPSGIRGRPGRNNREVLEGILWILRTGAPWRDLPLSIHLTKRAIVVFSNGLVMAFLKKC